MNDQARQVLCDIVSRYGRGVCDEPRRVRALLADLCPDLKRECHALVEAQEHGAAADLTRPTAGVPVELTLGRLARRLTDETAMSEEAARWAVESWAAALGAAKAAEPAAAPPPDPRAKQLIADLDDLLGDLRASRPSPETLVNLLRWRQSGEPERWVAARRGAWNHTDWLGLVDQLRQSPFWPLEPEQVGAELETAKAAYLKTQSLAAPRPIAPPAAAPPPQAQTPAPQKSGPVAAPAPGRSPSRYGGSAPDPQDEVARAKRRLVLLADLGVATVGIAVVLLVLCSSVPWLRDCSADFWDKFYQRHRVGTGWVYGTSGNNTPIMDRDIVSIGGVPLRLDTTDRELSPSPDFQFWDADAVDAESRADYKLTAQDKKDILGAPRIEAPPGFTVVPEELVIDEDMQSEPVTKAANKGAKTSIQLPTYRISGKVLITPSLNFPERKAMVVVRFPRVLEIKKNRGAKSPHDEPAIAFYLLVYPSQEAYLNFHLIAGTVCTFLVIVLSSFGTAAGSSLMGPKSFLGFIRGLAAAALLTGVFLSWYIMAVMLGRAAHDIDKWGPQNTLIFVGGNNVVCFFLLWLLAGRLYWSRCWVVVVFPGVALVVAVLWSLGPVMVACILPAVILAILLAIVRRIWATVLSEA